MRRITPILILLICLSFIPVKIVTAGLFGNDTLVSIDDNTYRMDDFKRWWKFWQEEEEALPDTPTPYIDWLLLSREAERMQMDETPGFKRQTRIFLQSRTLLMLKYEEVDSRINVTDADIKARYEEEYLPLWQVQRVEFTTEKYALAAWQKLEKGDLTLEQLLEQVETWKNLTGESMTAEERQKRAADYDGPVDIVENWLRPKQIDKGWADIFRGIKVGQVADPEEHGKGRVLYILKDQKGYSDEDFDKFRENIRKDIWKEQEDLLTLDLLDRLQEKYEVKIDSQRLAALDVNAPDDTFTDDAVITTIQENVSEKQFIAVIRRLMKSRPTAAHEAQDKDLVDTLKTETANNIIYQSVTNWESINRHYEEKEPFKWEYEFNYRHRLVQGLERQLFVPETDVNDEEIKQYYEEYKGRYTQPTLVKLYIVDETQAPIEKIWADVATGKDFQQAIKEHSELSLQSREAPANHLDPEVRDVVSRLVDGEMSQIFKAQGINVLVYLVERTPESPLPFDRVKESIRTTLKRQKLNQARKTYLDAIKSRSKIEVSERNWKKIQKELGGA